MVKTKPSRGNLRYILWRLDAKAVTLLLAFILAIAGISMIYSDIRDEGHIDVKSVFGEGKLKTGFVGGVVLFMAFILALACIVARAKSKPDHLELKRGKCSVIWEGDTVNFDHELAQSLIDALNQAERSNGKA